MVQDRIVDGFRIAELLASEIDGRRCGPLGDLAVTNADRTVSGTAEGERAYDVRFLAGDRDSRREPTPDEAGRLLAQVLVHEEGASVRVVAGVEAASAVAREEGLDVERCDSARTERGATIGIEYGAQVKRAADVLAAASEAVESGSATESE